MINAVGILDTNILVDILRGYPPALTWGQSNADMVLALPSVVRMEMVLGTSDKQTLQKAQRLMKPYPILFPSEADAQSAMERFEQFHLSHRVEIMDCFIAALSMRLQLPIYSRNVRDLAVFGDVSVIAPY